MFYCVHCGAGLQPEARSCTRCGSIPALADRAGSDHVCRVCDAPVANSWRHCDTCGTATERADRSTVTRTTIAAEAGSFRLRNEPKADAGRNDADVGDNHWPAELHPRL